MNYTISVAMAVYNGEQFLTQQIESIITQLFYVDELVISYNQSNDNTLNIINDYAKKYQNIRIVINEKNGVINNFNEAIMQCGGDIIVLSDQDDVWLEGKLIRIREAFNDNDIILYQHNCIFTDKDLKPTGEDLYSLRNCRRGFFKNVLINSYQGCCMAFKKDLIKEICPIPENIAMHDQWIGIVAEHYGKVLFDNTKLILYRRHDSNSSSDRLPLIVKFQYIIKLIIELIKRQRMRNGRIISS